MKQLILSTVLLGLTCCAGYADDVEVCSNCLPPSVMYANQDAYGGAYIDVIIRTYTYWASNCFTYLTYTDPTTGEQITPFTRGGWTANTSARMTIFRYTHTGDRPHPKPDAPWIGPYTVYRYDAIFQGVPADTPMTYTVKCDELPPCASCGHWTMAKDVRIRTPFVTKGPATSVARLLGFAIVADVWKGYKDPTTKVVKAITSLRLQGRVDFLLGAGDISNLEGESADYYNKTLSYYSTLTQSIPFYYVAGNHDYYNGNDGYSYFKLANLPLRAHPEGRPWRADEYNSKSYNGGSETHNRRSYYSFNYGRLKFMALNSLRGGGDDECMSGICFGNTGRLMRGEPQYRWLEKELQSASANNMIKIVYMHAPIDQERANLVKQCRDEKHYNLATCPHTAGLSKVDRKFAVRQYDLLALLTSYRVDLVFSGHLEPSEGTKVENSSRPSDGEPWRFVVSSSGACNDSNCDDPDRIGFVHVYMPTNNCLWIGKYSVNRSLAQPVKWWVYFTATRQLLDAEQLNPADPCYPSVYPGCTCPTPTSCQGQEECQGCEDRNGGCCGTCKLPPQPPVGRKCGSGARCCGHLDKRGYCDEACVKLSQQCP